MNTHGRRPARTSGYLAPGLALALLFGSLLAAATLSQDPDSAGEVRAYRVTLKNGGVVEVDRIRETPQSIILFMGTGQVVLRREAIERIDVVKRPRKPAPAPAPVPPPPSAAPLPQAVPEGAEKAGPNVQRRVDALLREYPGAEEDRRHVLARELAGLAPSCVPYLVRRLQLSEEPLRSLLVAVLAGCRHPSTVAALEPLVRNRKPELRAEAARILGTLGNPSGLSSLDLLLHDPDAPVRAAAVQALAVLGTRDAFRALGPACADPNAEVRRSALQALPVLAEKNDCREFLDAPLLDAYDLTRGDARAEVIAVMGVSGRKPLDRYVADALRDESPKVRVAAVTALLHLSPEGWNEQFLDRFLREQDSEVRIALAGAARILKLQDTIEPLISWLRSGEPELIQETVRALRTVTEKDYGADADRWSAWWAATRPRRN